MRARDSRLAILLLLAALTLTQSGCHMLMRQRRPSRSERELAQFAAKSRRPLQRVGVVALVNEADRFALIDSGSMPPPIVGTKLLSYAGDQQSAELKASAVQRRPFVVADFVSGTPRTGDEVFEAGGAAPAAVVAP